MSLLRTSAGLIALATAAALVLARVPNNDGPTLLQGALAGEVSTTSAILQTRLTAPERAADGDVPGAPGVIRFEISRDPAFGDPVVTPWARAEAAADFIVKERVTGLVPDTRYWWRAHYGATEENARPGEPHTFETHAGPTAARHTSFVVVTGMNYDFFHRDTARDGKRKYTGPDANQGYPALAAILALEPDFFIGTGDNVYYDHPPKSRAKTEAEMRRKWHEQFAQPRFVELFRYVPTYWEKDDHDHRYNDCDTEGDKLPSSELGIRVFREQVPIVDSDDAVTYRTFRVNRDLQFWLLEGRDYRSPNAMPDGPDKTLWGSTQREWLQRTLAGSDATFKIVVSPTPLVGPDDGYKKDNHTNPAGFRHEGRSFLTWARDTGLHDRGLYFVCGDRHWQYHSIDPTGFDEFSTGALVDANSRLGPRPGAKNSTDPDALVQQPYTSRQPTGGFLHVAVDPAIDDRPPSITFEFCDESGDLLHSVQRP